MTVEERLQDPKIKKWIVLQAALAAAYLLTVMLLPASGGFVRTLHFGMRKFLLLAMILLYAVIGRGAFSRQFLIAGAYWGWLVVSRLLNNGVSSLLADRGMIVDELIFVLLLGLGQVLDRKERLRFADLIGAAGALFSTVCAVIGLWCSVTRRAAVTKDGKILCTLFEMRRISSFEVNPNTCALWFLLGLIMLVYLSYRYPRLRWVTVPAAAVNYFAVGLAYSRNVQLAFAVCAALFLVIAVRPALGKTTVRVRACVLAAVAVISVPAAYKSFALAQMAVGAVSEVCAVSGEKAETVRAGANETVYAAVLRCKEPTGDNGRAEARTLRAADFVDDRGFQHSGRVDIWRTVPDTLRAEPLRLLRGCEESHVMDFSLPHLAEPYWHYHSMPLQLLMVTGIPGLLAMAALILLTGVKAMKICFSDEAEMAEKLLTMIVFAVIGYSMLDCPARSCMTLPVFFLIAGFAAETGNDISKKKSRS